MNAKYVTVIAKHSTKLTPASWLFSPPGWLFVGMVAGRMGVCLSG